MSFPVKHASLEEDLPELVPLHHQMPGKMGLLRAVARVFQRLENQVYDAYVSNGLPHASGTVLNFYGWLAGVQRAGLEDYWYRRLIATAFLAKRSTGSTDEVIGLWKTATDQPDFVEFRRYKKNCIVLTAWRSTYLPDSYARRAAELVAAGCPLGSVVLLESPSSNFVGSDERTDAPLPATTTKAAYPARVWWPQS